MIEKLAQFTDINVALIVGGLSLQVGGRVWGEGGGGREVSGGRNGREGQRWPTGRARGST